MEHYAFLVENLDPDEFRLPFRSWLGDIPYKKLRDSVPAEGDVKHNENLFFSLKPHGNDCYLEFVKFLEGRKGAFKDTARELRAAIPRS